MDLSVGPEHDNNHYPDPGDDATWQESWGWAWYDPRNDVSGWHHASVKRPLGVVDVKSWISVRGKLVHHFQTWDLPVPEGDYSDLQLGPLHLKTIAPVTHAALSIQDADVSASLTAQAVAGPHWYSRKAMEVRSERKNHWESYNRFEGSVTAAGETVPVQGFAWVNRSWGPRNLATLLTHRIIWAGFDDGLNIRLFLPTDAEGQKRYGFVIDQGRLRPVTKIEMDVTMGADGSNPKGCQVECWTEDGGGFRFSGVSGPGHAWTSTHPGPTPETPAMYSHASTVFDLGGRLGTGFLQVNELKRPTPQDLIRLSMA